MANHELQSRNIKDVYKLTPMQEGIYFHALTDQQSSAYFSQTAYRFFGSLQPLLVEQGVAKLMERHDVLRTVFNHTKADAILQVVLKERTPDFKFIDIRGEQNKEAIIEQYRLSDRARGFDLTKDVLIRVTLLRVEEDSYEFIWSHHHILMDGWCAGILISEFTELYESLLQQREPRLQTAVAYREFVQWMESRDKEAAAAYWSQYLNGYSAGKGLPRLRMPHGNGYDNREASLTIPAELTAGLQQTGVQYKVTLNTMLQAVWALLLSQYSNSKDLVFGSVVSVRPAAIRGIDSMVGLCINTLPVRVQLNAGESFCSLLQIMQQQALEAEAYQFYPLSAIQLQSGVSQLIDHVFITENFPIESRFEQLQQDATGSSFNAEYKAGFSQTNYDFNIIVLPGKEITIRFNYNADVYDTSYIEQVAAHFLRIVSQVVFNPATALNDIQLISNAEKNSLLEKGRGPVRLYDGTLDSLFADRVAAHPQAIAVCSETSEMTYAELDMQSTILGIQLQRMGIQRGDYVGVMTGRTTETIISILAICKAGGVYVPLDAAHPVARIRHIVEDTGVQVLLCTAPYAARFNYFSGKVFVLDVPLENEAGINEPCRGSKREDKAYIIYTSGTTGLPKGVPIRQESIVDRILYHNEHLGLNNNDGVLQFASVGFDASLVEIFMALLSGGRLVILPEALKQNAEQFQLWLPGTGVTAAIFPPAYLKILNRHPLPGIRIIISTGEAAVLEDVLWYARTKEIYNGYGPTETCVGATFHKVNTARAADYRQSKGLPIGNAFANTNIYVLDDQQHLVPAGMPGEIYVSGIGLSHGYLHQEALTRSHFIANPYSTGNSDRCLYRTGDLGRWNKAFELEYMGRIDNQVQLRGVRVEIGEIEHAMLRHPQVKEAAVAVWEDNGDVQLAGYVVSTEQISAADMRTFLKEFLPEYMIPVHIIELTSIPLTTNGKTDRSRLTRPALTERSKNMRAAVTTEETLLVQALIRVLGKKEVGMEDNFFELGGDSIKAIQIASWLYRNGYKLEVKEIFSYPGVEALAQRMQPVQRIANQGVVSGEMPLTPIQSDFFEREFDFPHHFNQSIMLTSDDRFDQDFIEEVISRLQTHHDALRMVYRKEEGRLTQYNQGIPHPIKLVVTDFRNSEDPAAALEAAAQELQRSFMLEEGPLFATGLYRLPDGDRLLLIAHHLVVDGISWRIILEDVGSLYEQRRKGEAMELPLKTDSFKSWAEGMEVYANSDRFLKEQAYWLAMAGVEADPLPVTQMNVNEPAGNGAFSFHLNEASTNLLLGKVQEAYHTEINDILLAGFGLSLEEVFGCEKIWISLEGHGREEILEGMDITRTVGWFTSTYPVLLEATHKDDMGMHIKQTKEALRSIPDKGIGYGLLKYMRKQEGTPLLSINPRIIFNYLGQFDSDINNSLFNIAAEYAGDSTDPSEKSLYDIAVSGMVVEGKLRINIRYDRKMQSPATMELLQERLQFWLTTIIGFCAAKDTNEHTPGDFGYKGLSIQQADALQAYYAAKTGSTVTDVYALTPMQEGMLFHALMEEKSAAYLYQVSYHVKGTVVPSIVEESANALLKRHDILRTVFEYQRFDTLLQVVLAKRSINFLYEDIRYLKDRKRKQDFLDQFMASDKKKAFNLSEDVLFRLAMFQLEDGEYVFTWSCHHILMDGWCMGILISEFIELYQAAVQKRQNRLAIPKPFNQYIQWLKKTDTTTALQYWSGYLDEYESQLQLPGYIARRDQEEYKAALHTLTFSAAQTEALQGLAMQSRVTQNTLMQTLWGILVGKYNDTGDVVFGSVVSGRQAPVDGIESMIGLFINTIPVRVQYNAADTFVALMQQVQKGSVESEPWHFCSLAQIQAGSMLKQGLIDHFLEFENYPLSEQIEGVYGNGAEKEAADWAAFNIQSSEFTNYDLSLVVSAKQQITMSFKYNEAVYPAAAIEMMARHFEMLVVQVLADKWININELQLTLPAEQDRILELSAGTKRDYPNTVSYASLFRQQALKTPAAPAVNCSGQSLSFKQLDERANAIAACLRQEYQVDTENIVGVYMERGLLWPAAILGIWKAGGVYLPLDTQWPADRVAYILKNAGAKLVICSEGISTGINGIDELDITTVDTATWAPEVPVLTANGNNAAYLLYTSGSTGNPKGVFIEHASMINHHYAKIEYLELDTHSKVAQTASHSFDISIWQMMAPLLAGAQVYIYPRATVLEVENFISRLADDGITILQLVPTYLSAMLEIAENRGTALRFPPLKYMFSTAEELKPALAVRWFAFKPAIPLVNGFGPTEASDNFTHGVLTEAPPAGRIPIGRPIPNISVYLVNKNSQLCPIGVVGEIWVSGAGVGRGYAFDAGKTAEVFMEDPFRKGERVYKTGDLGRWTANGNLEFFGRRDYQVKINGHRIELGEIERALTEAPGVKQAAVVYFNDAGSNCLAGYIEWREGAVKDISVVKDWLQRCLPGYMMPSTIIELDAFPLTVSGKINRKQLVKPQTVIAALPEGAADVENEQEAMLLDTWKKVLGLTTISRFDNFFNIGGDSIRAIQICSRAYTAGYKLEVKHIFQSPSIAELVRHLQPITRVVDQSPVTGTAPLTPVQLRFFEQPLQNRDHYNQALMLHFRERLHAGILSTVFTAITTHHDALRMRYMFNEDCVTEQVNEAPALTTVLYYDWKELPDSISLLEAEANRLQQSMKLTDGNLFKVAVFSLADGDRLLMIAHHLVIDGVSWRIILEDLLTLFSQHAAGKAFELPLKTDAFRLWGEQLQVYANSEHFQQEKKYWQKMAAVPMDLIPGKNGIYKSAAMAVTNFSLDQSATAHLLKDANIAFGTDVNDLLITALGLSLQQSFGVKKLMIDLEGHGREEIFPDLNMNRTVGWFTSMFPVLLDTSSYDTLAQLIIRTKENIRQVPNKGIGYGIFKYLTPEGASFQNQPQVIFNYLGQFDEDIDQTICTVAAESAGDTVQAGEYHPYHLNIGAFVGAGQLKVKIEYDVQYFDAAIIQSFSNHFATSLQQVITCCREQEFRQATPSDYGYSELSIDDLSQINSLFS
jgi:amino acid adenylation domain-containing protein/non-ribosomal peptide synthase protein (TIGR01720 family)